MYRSLKKKENPDTEMWVLRGKWLGTSISRKATDMDNRRNIKGVWISIIQPIVRLHPFKSKVARVSNSFKKIKINPQVTLSPFKGFDQSLSVLRLVDHHLPLTSFSVLRAGLDFALQSSEQRQ